MGRFSSSGADVARSAADTDSWCRLLGVSTRDAGCRLRNGGRGSGGWKGGVLIERREGESSRLSSWLVM